jgi:DNA repair ATPase RecN
LKDFAEDFEDLDDFYNSQFQTWQNLSKALNDQFKANRPFLEKEPTAKQALDELDRIYAMSSPYDQLRYINSLIEQLQAINQQLVLEKRQCVQTHINQRLDRVISTLAQIHAPDELRNKALHPLQQCKKRIDATDSIPQIVSEELDAENHEMEAEQLINGYIEKQRQKEPTKIQEPDSTSSIPQAKRTVSISPLEIMVSHSKTGFIETETDIDQYLNQLRDKLLNAVKAGDRVRIK